MRESNQAEGKVPPELLRRHKAAAMTVAGLLIATLLLSLVSLVGNNFFRQQYNPPLDIAVRITILMLGLGSIVWRRTKFSTMRLRDIGSLQGAHGLLGLQGTGTPRLGHRCGSWLVWPKPNIASKNASSAARARLG